MKCKLLSLVVIWLVIPAFASGKEKSGFDASKAARGERAFGVYCSACHGKQATGNGPLAKDLKVPPADLTRLSSRNNDRFPLEMVLKTIEHGRSVRGHGTEEMPAWGDAFKMTEQTEEAARQKMEFLAHYLWSIQHRP